MAIGAGSARLITGAQCDGCARRPAPLQRGRQPLTRCMGRPGSGGQDGVGAAARAVGAANCRVHLALQGSSKCPSSRHPQPAAPAKGPPAGSPSARPAAAAAAAAAPPAQAPTVARSGPLPSSAAANAPPTALTTQTMSRLARRRARMAACRCRSRQTLLASWLLSSGDANLRRHAAGVLAAVSATWRHPLLARAMPCFALGRCALPGRWAYQARCKGAGDDASRSMCLQVNLATCISLWCGSAASAGTPWTPPAPTHPAGPTPPSFQPPEPAPLAPAPLLEHKKRHSSAAPKGGPTKHRRSQDGGARA